MLWLLKTYLIPRRLWKSWLKRNPIRHTKYKEGTDSSGVTETKNIWGWKEWVGNDDRSISLMRKSWGSCACLVWGRLGEDLTHVHKYLKEGGQEDGTRFSSVVPSSRTREQTDTDPLQVLPEHEEEWNRLPREGVEFHLETFQSCLDTILSSTLMGTLLKQGGWTRWAPVVPSNLNHSVIPCFSCLTCSWCPFSFWWCSHMAITAGDCSRPVQALLSSLAQYGCTL